MSEEYKSFSSSLCNILHSPVTSSLLGPNILLNTMFSNTLSLGNGSYWGKIEGSHNDIDEHSRFLEYDAVLAG